jgi:regulator of protease activity HflC (stomatin/prohibitin superfamily)
MKRQRINKGKIGLVFRNGDYKRSLFEGLHWLRFNDALKVYDMAKSFIPDVEFNIILKDQLLADRLTIVEVKDHEIALQFIEGNFKNVLTPGRYAFWKGLVNLSFVIADLSRIEIQEDIPAQLLNKPEILQYVRVFVVESYEKGVLMINGKPAKLLEQGVYYFWKNPIQISLVKTDLRQLQMEIQGQEILTKDKATIRVNFFVRYKTVDIEKALLENKEFDKQLYMMVQLAIREYIGTNTLDELLERKTSVSESVLNAILPKADEIGVSILDCGLRDIILPGEVKDIMNKVLVAEKTAQANIITRREETASTRSLLNTAKLMEENSMLFKLKEMEYLERITEKINTVSLSGGGLVLDQLKGLFVSQK